MTGAGWPVDSAPQPSLSAASGSSDNNFLTSFSSTVCFLARWMFKDESTKVMLEKNSNFIKRRLQNSKNQDSSFCYSERIHFSKLREKIEGYTELSFLYELTARYRPAVEKSNFRAWPFKKQEGVRTRISMLARASLLDRLGRFFFKFMGVKRLAAGSLNHKVKIHRFKRKSIDLALHQNQLLHLLTRLS